MSSVANSIGTHYSHELESSIEAELQQLANPANSLYDFSFERSIDLIRGRNAHKLFMALALFTSDAAREKADAAREKEKSQAVVLAKTDLLRASTQGTVLALRVKKADVDAFATGKLDLEALEKKVGQHSYPGSGYGITSINSWSRSGATGR